MPQQLNVIYQEMHFPYIFSLFLLSHRDLSSNAIALLPKGILNNLINLQDL